MFTLLTCVFLLFSVLQGAVFTTVKPYYNLDHALDHFIEFVKKYDKVYPHGDAAERFENFVTTLGLINENNKKDTAIHNINKFADMSTEEFAMKMHGAKFVEDLPPPEPYVKGNFTAPLEVDWRLNNVVTPVKDQGHCGSCWTFAAVATIESQYAKKTKTLVQFSEQQIMDCDPESRGCAGGSPHQAMQYIQGAGLELESAYPYIGQKSTTCSYQSGSVVTRVDSSSVQAMTEEGMVELVASYGPISVIICALGLNTYDGSVWSGPSCSGRTLQTCLDANGNPQSHAVTIVGYGTYGNLPYWLVKNSWGANWGDRGYFKMLRGSRICLVDQNVAIRDVIFS